MNKSLTISIFALLAISAFATTWHKTEVPDPISGEPTTVQNVNSYGSYIYRWPSKYDAVYWPFTDPNYIRFNAKSGYIAFGSDFEELETNKIEQITEFLKSNYKPNTSLTNHLDRLHWAEKVYSARGTDDKFYIRHYCLLSYLTRTDEQASNKFRKQALDKIEDYLKTAKPSFYRSQLYIVAGFYSKLLGDDAKAENFWSSPERLKFDDATTVDAMEYLEEILKTIKNDEYKEKYYR